MSRSFKMSNDVYAAMLARGFTGEMRSYTTYRMTGSRLAAASGQPGDRHRSCLRGAAVAAVTGRNADGRASHVTDR